MQSTIENKGSNIISYHKLASMPQIFDVNLSRREKHGLVGRKQGKSACKKRSSNDASTGERSSFLGRFLHSDVLCIYIKDAQYSDRFVPIINSIH